MTTRRQFIGTAVASLVAPFIEFEDGTRVLTGRYKPGDVITISGVRNVNGLSDMPRMFVVVSLDENGATLSAADAAGKIHSVPAHRAQPWPRHHKRDRWA